eukprot:s1275_g3.t1
MKKDLRGERHIKLPNPNLHRHAPLALGTGTPQTRFRDLAVCPWRWSGNFGPQEHPAKFSETLARSECSTNLNTVMQGVVE